MKTVAFIPAKSTSQRIKDKNVVELAGKPLMAYSIAAALDSHVFDDVYVVCRDARYQAIAKSYGAKVYERSAFSELPKSRDFQWVFEALSDIHFNNQFCERHKMFAILRPTSPFRTVDTIRRAYDEFNEGIDSLRAVEPVKQHPFKMWYANKDGPIMSPLMKQSRKRPEHSSQTQYLPKIYTQNASLEMAWVKTVWDTQTIARTRVQAFYTEGYEGFDINEPWDLVKARYLIKHGHATLPEVRNG